MLQSFIFVLVAPTRLNLALQTLVLGFELDKVLPRELRTSVQLLRKLGLEGIELLLLLGEAVAQLSAFNIHSKLRKISNISSKIFRYICIVSINAND